MKPKLVTRFVGPGGQTWRIYHASRRKNPALFRMADGRSCLGITYYRGPLRHRIYIDSALSDEKKFEVTLHELLHVALEDTGLIYIIEEPIVDELAARVAGMLEQL